MANLGNNKAYKVNADELQARWLSDNMGALVGVEVVVLTAPAQATGLVLKATKGPWLVRPNDHTADMPAALDPTGADLALGTAAWKLLEGQEVIVTASEGSEFTFRAFAATDVLTYYWI